MKKLLGIVVLGLLLSGNANAGFFKDFFNLNGEKVMFYIMKGKYSFKPPQRQYLNIINQGYEDNV